MKQQAYERSRYFAGVFQLHALGTLANTGLIPKNGVNTQKGVRIVFWTVTASRRRLRGRCWRSGYFAGGHLVVPVAGSSHVGCVLGSGCGSGAFGCGKVAVFDSPVVRDKAITVTFLDGTKIRA